METYAPICSRFARNGMLLRKAEHSYNPLCIKY